MQRAVCGGDPCHDHKSFFLPFAKEKKKEHKMLLSVALLPPYYVPAISFRFLKEVIARNTHTLCLDGVKKAVPEEANGQINQNPADLLSLGA